MAIDVKKLFADAIIELSNEKPLSKVTVTDIVKRVGTGRQTFYILKDWGFRMQFPMALV